MPGTSPRTALLGAAAAGGLLLLAAPTPAAALSVLRTAGRTPVGADPAQPLVALLSLLAWALALWLLVVLAVTAGGHLPGAAGRALAAVARRTAPAAVRRTAEVALGLTVAVGVVGASPAAAAPPSPDRAAQPAAAADEVAPDLDWAPGAAAVAAPPAPHAPAPHAPAPHAPAPQAPVAPRTAAAPAGPPTAATGAGAAVVVRPGDTLWGLAEQDLRKQAAAAPSDAQVAATWPAWWAANRDVVGEDPHLLQPGTPLVAPAAAPPTRR